MTSRTRILCWLYAGWMAFVWVTRLRNIAGDDGSSGSTRTAAYLLAATCLAGAVALAVIAARRGPVSIAVGIASAHGVVWVLRGVQIALADHGVAFKVVHVVLAAVSVVGAALVVRSTRRVGTEVAAPV